MDESINEEYIESIDVPPLRHIQRGLMFIQQAWKAWKDGPLTKSSDIKPAKKELIQYIAQILNKNIK
jgi:hypothetical protein